MGDFPFALEANASSDLPVHFEVSDLALATINSNILQIRNSGLLTVTVSQGGNSLYNPAEPVSQTFSIGYGNLSLTQLPDSICGSMLTDINFDQEIDIPDDFVDLNKISLWADKSGNFNSPVQPTHSQMPTWKAPSASSLALIEFSSDSNQSLTFQLPISQPSLLFAVLKQSVPAPSNLFGGDLYLIPAMETSNLAIIMEIL